MGNESSYDLVPYGSMAVTEMSPNRLATVGLLFGLDPAPVGTCRILDIGCAEGGNVVSLALALPGARVVGVDLSERQIALGRERVRKLGLGNAQLVCADLAGLKADFGEFDYVTAHGVYSWIAPPQQASLLRACRDLLAPGGIACVSYNTFPGWQFRLVLREMARFRAREGKDPLEKVALAREGLQFYCEQALAEGTPEKTFLVEEWQSLASERDEYLFHELLEEHNHPCWFHEFAARAEAAGLSYVADAKLGAKSASRLPPEILAALEGLTLDRIEAEQYADFLENRSFRRSLLVRDGRTPLGEPDPSALDRLNVVTHARPESTPVDLAPGAPATFVTWRGVRLTTNDPEVKRVLARLWDVAPAPVPFRELAGPGSDRLRAMLLQAWDARFVDFLPHVPAFATAVGERPVASPLVRLQAAEGSSRVTSLLHRNIRIEDDVTAFVLARLDGTRDLEALSRETCEAVVAEGLLRGRDGLPVTDSSSVRAVVDQALPGILARAAREALLVG